MTPEALAKSRELALELGQIPIESETTPGHFYTVVIGPTGEATCTCGDFEHRGGECKHIRHEKEKRMTTEQSTALVPITVTPPTSVLPTKQELSIIGTIARTVIGARGHAVPTGLDSPAKAAAVMLAGWEMGVRPMTALRHVFVVNGRTEPDAQLMAGIVMAKEPDAFFEIVEETEESTTMRLVRPAKNLRVEFTYTDADAKAAGLFGKGAWANFKKDMRRYAANKRLCRVYCPDLINNVASVPVSDMDALVADVEGEVEEAIDVTAVPAGELYSPGDEPTDGVVNLDTGEILEEPAPPATILEPQRAAIVEWQEALEGKHGKKALQDAHAWARGEFDYAVEAGSFHYLRLTPDDADLYIAHLREIEEARPAAKQEGLLPTT